MKKRSNFGNEFAQNRPESQTRSISENDFRNPLPVVRPVGNDSRNPLPNVCANVESEL